MAKQYNFYCTICGDPFSAQKKHARCCGAECRVVLSNIMRYEVTDTEHIQEPVDKDEVAEKFEKATGTEMSEKELSRLPGKDKPETGPISRLVKSKKKADPPVAPKEKDKA